MARKETQAQQDHPKLYALGQHRIIRALGPVADLLQGTINHVTTVKPRRGRKARTPRQPRQGRTYRARAPRTVVVHVYSGATVNLHNV